MLKIKDNVDLKELEKYNFIESKYQGFDAYIRYNPLVGSTELISFNKKNPLVLILTERGNHPSDDYEYICKDENIIEQFFDDIIQAGLIEKVQKENKI